MDRQIPICILFHHLAGDMAVHRIPISGVGGVMEILKNKGGELQLIAY